MELWLDSHCFQVAEDSGHLETRLATQVVQLARLLPVQPLLA